MSLNISNIYYKRETLVIGMIKMSGNHNADLVNSFEFDKSWFDVTVSDEGSAYVRLFKQPSQSRAS